MSVSPHYDLNENSSSDHHSSPSSPPPPPPSSQSHNTRHAATQRRTARRARRRARRAAERDGRPVPVASFAEYLRLPNLLLPLAAVMAVMFGDLPAPAVDMSVSQLGFSDLSSTAFSADEQFVCGLGLGFIPTPHFSEREFSSHVMRDTYAFVRRILIYDYFNGPDAPVYEEMPCPPKFRIANPDFWPPPEHNPSSNVLEYCQMLTESVASRLKQSRRTIENLSYDMRTCLSSLYDSTTHVFSIADKNLGLTAMDVKDYEAACKAWLARTHTLVELSAEEVIQRTLRALTRAYTPLENLLPAWVWKWLAFHSSPLRYRIPAFRVMPKLHKPRAAGAPVDTRPLTGNHCWATQPYALLVAHLVLPVVRRTPCFCKDSDSFIRSLSAEHVPRGAVLFSYDVEKLYPSILHGHCISTVRAYLLQLNFRFTLLVCELLAVILAYNYCEFDGQIFHQHTGFATGVACGSEIANLYLSALETRNLHLFSANLLLLRRYIDDGFGLWVGSQTQLRDFIAQLYLDSGLRITTVIDLSSMIFLDMVVFKSDNFNSSHRLDFRCYQKPTNAYLYLPYTSAHPPHVWHAFIRGELIRYVKRCSRLRDFVLMKLRFWIRLLNRGYPHAVLRKSFATVSFDSRNEFLLPRAPAQYAPTRETLIPLVLTYSRQLVDNNIHALSTRNLTFLTDHPHFRNVKFKTCWRAAPKIGAGIVTFRYPKGGTPPLERNDPQEEHPPP